MMSRAQEMHPLKTLATNLGIALVVWDCSSLTSQALPGLPT
jgi:hypothetical protein